MATAFRSSTPLLLRHARRGMRSLTTTTTTTPTPTPPTAAEAAAEQIVRASGDRTTTHHQTLDGHQLRRLSLTLNRPHLLPGLDVTTAAAPIPDGTPLPPGYHLVYFTPASLESDLGADGTDGGAGAGAGAGSGGFPAAPRPFTRRMWAGGRMRWAPGAAGTLRVGDAVEERTRLVGAAAKRSRRRRRGGAGGGEMVLVEVEKEFWGPRGLALVDRRSWVYMPPPPPPGAGAGAGGEAPAGGSVPGAAWRRSSVEDVPAVDGSGVPERRFRWSPVALFRFSALTFNAHMIHYSEGWAGGVEGHPGLVVHGPLNLILMMDYFRDVYGREAREVSYRALSPLYAGDEYCVRTASTGDAGEGMKAWEIVVQKGAEVCMKGTILADG